MYGSAADKLHGVGVRDLLEDNVGHDANKYVAMLGSIGIFVLLNNLISLVPTLESPTAQVSVPSAARSSFSSTTTGPAS